MMKYRYYPLSTPSSTRLLALLQEQGSTSYELQEVDLDTKPSFEALSYTWSDPDTETVDDTDENVEVCIGEVGCLTITKNLHTILQYLSDSEQGQNMKKVWIDQICIDQENLEELGQKLGITRQAREFTKEQYLGSFALFLGRKWFSRAWVVQEAALSSKPVVIHGGQTFDLRALDCLLLVAVSLEKDDSGRVRHSELLKTRGAHMLRHIQRCRQRVLNVVDRRGRLGFLDILQKLSFATDATDARDQVYAFLAFQDEGIISIRRDYSLSTSFAFAMIAANFIYSTKSLAILGLVLGKLLPGPLPSWAVDWRKAQSTQGTRLDAGVHCRFNAACDHPHIPKMEPLAYDLQLLVRGKIINRVARVSAVTRPRSESAPIDNVRLTKEIENISNLDSKLEGLDEAAKTDFIKRVFAVLVAYDPGCALDEGEKDLDLTNLLFTYNHSSSIKQLSEYAEKSEYFETALKKLARRAGIVVRKRLFTGADKRLLGLGPTDLSPGDLICVLHGSRVPILLRSRGHGYEVIGQCYYENWMYGKQVDWEEHGADELNLF
ncbi:hypothetical protein CC78DRAFT_540843 [Lojkania enalia]|uniref:Heterokaryon incompatibility domain-containing protein n=1 Tax=Lojkania enalia TaxID=147567 RepID=A0A9P4KHY8_9PLEO|nr:hypothetical protein CC78DRAFT_540843 [Didymosphaeria enalia]